MANDCFYKARVSGRTKESVRQFIDALEYRDLKDGYYMCRIFDCDYLTDGILQDEDGIYYADVEGCCAWSVAGCMIDTDYGDWRGMKYGEPQFRVFRDSTKRICYANIGVTAQTLCRILGCGFEVWSNESGYEFQEHYVINASGELVERDTCHWEQGFDADENGDWIEENPAKDVGGFKDYGKFMDAYDLMVTE